MSKSTDIAEFQRAMLAGQDADDSPAGDRRKNERQIATFRTCCVVVDGEAHPAILRNMSDGGAMFEALVATEPGDIVTYWWDGIDAVEARVAWVDGTRIGVANISGPAEPIEVPRPRATRVPVHLPVRIWSGGVGRRAELENISLSGIALHGLAGIVPGTLCTIEIGSETLHNATVVRTDQGVTGIRFERPLAPARLMQLIEGGGDPARVIGKPCATPKAEAKPEPQPEAAPAPTPVRRFL